jgi:hypothetical protein
MKFRSLAIVALVLAFAAPVGAQTAGAKIDQALALVEAVRCVSDTCAINKKNILTRLASLKTQIPLETEPQPLPPTYITQAEFTAAIAELAARIAKLEAVPVPAPIPVPVPVPVPAEVCGNAIDDDKDGQVDEGCIVLPPPSTEAHAYFDALCKTAGAVCYPLRTDAEIDRWRFGVGTYPVKVRIDAAAQAARWQWVKDDLSAENLRLPIHLARPATGSSKLLIISDHRWDDGWFAEFMRTPTERLDGWKWLQVTANTAEGVTRQRVWFEPQMRWIGFDTGILSYFGVRPYFAVRPPTTEGPSTPLCGKNFGESLGPMLACFKAKSNTWTRVWIEIELKAGDAFASTSMWMADETQEPVAIIRNAETISYGLHTEFWFEYNTSSETRVGGPMAAWGRNVIILKDADAASLLVKPVK